MPSPLFDALKDYEYHLHVERNLAPRTIREYLDDLTDLGDFLAKHRNKFNPSVSDIRVEDLKAFLVHLQAERDFTGAGTARILSSLRGFFRHCQEVKAIAINPTDGLRTPKLPKRLPVYLVESELRRLFSAPDQATPLGIRDHAIFVVLANTGLRVSEIVGLTLDRVNFEDGLLRVFGKGRKERMVPMNQSVCTVLTRWLEVRPPCDSPALFVGTEGRHLGEPLGARGVQVLLRKHGLKANIPSDRLTPHKLRHTFATLLHMNSVDILEIQALLGHANIASTQIYTQTNPSRLRSAVGTLSHISQEIDPEP